MNDPRIFPFFFLLLWFGITTALAVVSGWFALAKRFPDTNESPLLRLRSQSGLMRGVSMGGMLYLSVCDSGLRVGMVRLFGPFCRSFLVPWSEIHVVRKELFGQPMAELQFGQPLIGNLSLQEHVANRIGRMAGEHWPERYMPEEASRQQTALALFRYWVGYTALAATFFTVTPMLDNPGGPRPSLAETILFPATIFGIASVVAYVRRRRR